MGKELNSVTYGAFLNVDYLPQEDMYVYKKPKTLFKFNVIGAGMIAHEHIKVTMLEGRAVINGIYDRNEISVKHATEMFEQNFPKHDLKVYKTLEEACFDDDVDGLIICTPNYSHIEIMRTAVKSGKHIMLEKPMVTTLKDAYEMLELAKDYPAIFQVGLQYRYKAIYAQTINEVLEQKNVGEIKTLNIVEHRLPFLDKIDQWNKFSKYSGGTLVEKCCHYFDLLNLLAQSKPKKVFGVGGMAVNFKDFEYKGEKSDILDHAAITIVYENGIHATFNLCMFSPMFYEEITVCGDEGRLRAFENEDYLPLDRPQTHLEVLSADFRQTKVMSPCYPKTIQESGHMGGTYFEHRLFVDNILGKETNTATMEEGFWSVVVGIAAELAVKENRVIDIDELLKEYK